MKRVVNVMQLLLVTAALVPAQQPTLKMYTAADGLGDNRVFRFVSDMRGFLWLCTRDGLTRFDGQHFLNFNSEYGAPFDRVDDLLEMPNGDFWIASSEVGLIRMAGNGRLEPLADNSAKRFHLYRLGGDAASNSVLKLHRDKAGFVWIGTNGGLYRVNDRTEPFEIRPVPLRLPGYQDRELKIFGISEAPDGSIYASLGVGVVRILPDSRRVFYLFSPGYRAGGLGAMVFHDGVLWLGQQGGLFLLRPSAVNQTGPDVEVNDAFTRAPSIDFPAFSVPTEVGKAISVRVDRDPARSYVFDVLELADGRIWLASEGGLFEFSRGEVRRILRHVPFDYALQMGQDSVGNIWLAIHGSGVARLEFGGIATFGEAEGVGQIPTQVMIDNSGSVIVAGWPRQLHILSGEQFKTIDLKIDRKADFSGSPCVLQDHSGGWWAATTLGLYRFPATKHAQDLAGVSPIALLRRTAGNSDDELKSQFEDAAGDMWLGFAVSATAPIMRWERRTGRLYQYSANDGLPAQGGSVMGFAQDSDKSLWVAFSQGGLARYRDGKFESFREAQGLPSSQIARLVADRDGQIWVLIFDHGLVRIDGSSGGRLTLKQYPVTERLRFTEYGRPLFADRAGRIYTGLSHGVDRLDPATGLITHYGPAEGIAYMVGWPGAEDSQGAIWLCTIKNAVRIPPGGKATVTPPVLIGGLRIAGVDYSVPVNGARRLHIDDLPYQKNSIQLDFLSLSLAADQAPLFQYKLDGAASGWSTPTSIGTVSYANLAPGTYDFEARRALRGNSPGDAPAHVTFRILPPFWKRAWFLGITLFAVAGSLFAFERYRAAQLRRLRFAMAALGHANEALDIESSVSRILAQSTGDSALLGVLEAMCRKMGWDRATLWESDRGTALIHRTAEWPPDETRSSESPAILFPGQQLCGEAIQSKKLQWIAAPAAHAALPILVGDLPLGAFELRAHSVLDRDSQDSTLTTIAAMIGQWMERLRAEGALRASEVRFRTLAETASDAIITINEQGRVLFCNPSVSDIFGYTAEQMAGQGLTMLMPPAWREAHRQGFERYLKTGERRISWKAVELPGLRADGREILLELSFGEFERDSERFFTAVIRDITERKRTEQALERSREERLAEIERIRRRIAIDLHDDIGSSLTQISVLSEVARQKAPEASDLERPLQIIAESSRELIDSMSDIVWAINPQRDHLADLVHRMRRFAADTLTSRNIKFTMSLPGSTDDIKLEGNLRREVFLIFKEGLNNAVRHSGCTFAEIELRLENDGLRLILRDNGKGFDPAAESTGYGLLSMSGRAAGIGARFEIQSTPGKGSAINLEVPLNNVSS